MSDSAATGVSDSRNSARGARVAPRWLIAAGIAVAAATAVGAAFAPYLLVHHPWVLLALNPWPRHQVLVAPNLPFVAFVVVVAARSIVACAVAFELGRFYGARGVAFIEGRSSESGRLVRTIERLFGRFSDWLLLFTPGWLTSALAGMSGVSRRRCMALNAAGVIGWAAAYHRLGGWLEPWTAPLVQFLRENLVWATLICVVLVAAYQGHSLWKRSRGPRVEAARPDNETS